MAYEIPQQLQHKEKILFGLTFSQLAWTSLFGSLILIILTNKRYDLVTKLILSMFPSVLGILFVFFDLNKWIRNIFSFLKFRSAKILSLKMKRLLNISKVENNIIKSHEDIAILQITPINFAIKTNDEKESIIYGFQRFLNSLDFPVQFVVSTNDLNIDSYLNNLKERVNNEELFNDFSEFMVKNIEKNQMRNRLFYLIIPKKSDLEIQCKVCCERLESIGLKTSRLKDKQILENLHHFFNDLNDKREQKNKIDDGLHYLIAPNYIKDNVDSLIINQKQCRIISAVGFPRMVESGFLDKIISSNDDFDISIHIEPFSIETMMVILNRS